MDLAPKYKFSIAACARWETKNISEWIAYHRAIGFEHIYLYCNDNDPAELYECLLPLLGESVSLHHVRSLSVSGISGDDVQAFFEKFFC